MPHGSPIRMHMCLSEADAATLEAWRRSSTIRANQKRRGRLIQWVAQGRSVTAAAVALGMSRNKAYQWIARFQAEGLAGLAERPRAPYEKKQRGTPGRKTTMVIALTPEDHAMLLAWHRSQTIGAGRARRAALLLLLAAGHPVSEVARRVGVSRRLCYKWAWRYQMEGIPGLYDRKVRVRMPVLDPHAARQRA